MMRAVLVGYCALVLLFAPRLLHRRRWVDRAPGLAILAWQSIGLAVVSALLLLGLLTLFPVTGVRVDLVHLLHACAALLTARDLSVSDVVVVVSAAVLAALLGRSCWRHVAGATRARRAHRELVDLVSVPMRNGPARERLLDHTTALAYCIPGRRGRIVVTTAATQALNDAELAAVLAHERAHLRGRHHVVLLWSRILRSALPLGAFRTGDDEMAVLIEMLADDAVRTPLGRRSLAHAVLTLGEGGPQGALAAGAGTDVAHRRLQRLLSVPAGLTRPAQWAVAGACAALVTVPWLSAAPALAAVSGQCLLVT